MAIKIVLTPKYFLFEQDPTPWPSYLIKDTPNWVYDSDTNAIYDQESLQRQIKPCHLPFLSFETREGHALNDLSNFIQEIKIYRASDTFPTVRQIVSLWSLQSGTVVKSSATVSVITDKGDSVDRQMNQVTTVQELVG